MQFLTFVVALAGALTPTGLAAPAPAANDVKVEERGLINKVLVGVLGTVVGELNALKPSASGTGGYSTALSVLHSATPTATPTSPQQASAALSAVYNASPTPNNLYAAIAQIVGAGLSTQNTDGALGVIGGGSSADNSENNSNPRNPSPPVYPQAGASDAPYDLPEAQLRGAIRIPSTFKYGAPGSAQPVILVPGTGDTGYTTYIGSYIPLLTGSSIGDPVWLNIPSYLLQDAQTSAEYVAYAINYISGISNGCEVAVFAWSQGNLLSQWAFQYWPSTRSKVTDLISFSPDFHGTIEANFIALGEPLPPSILQQEYNSKFITTLRSQGGDSAYVPTTTVYSGLGDEIVEPQQGTGASAYLLDARNVGVTNNEVQLVCTSGLAGTYYSHEGTLYNPLGFALAVDALSHPGPGQPSRLNLASVCAPYLTLGLNVNDFALTENSIVIAGVAVLAYPGKVTVEPPIKSYASPAA